MGRFKDGAGGKMGWLWISGAVLFKAMVEDGTAGKIIDKWLK